MSSLVKTQRAAFLMRSNKLPQVNITNVEGNMFDFNLLHDKLHELLDNDNFDYLIIEPIKFKNSLF